MNALIISPADTGAHTKLKKRTARICSASVAISFDFTVPVGALKVN